MYSMSLRGLRKNVAYLAGQNHVALNDNIAFVHFCLRIMVRETEPVCVVARQVYHSVLSFVFPAAARLNLYVGSPHPFRGLAVLLNTHKAFYL